LICAFHETRDNFTSKTNKLPPQQQLYQEHQRDHLQWDEQNGGEGTLLASLKAQAAASIINRSQSQQTTREEEQQHPVQPAAINFPVLQDNVGDISSSRSLVILPSKTAEISVLAVQDNTGPSHVTTSGTHSSIAASIIDVSQSDQNSWVDFTSKSSKPLTNQTPKQQEADQAQQQHKVQAQQQEEVQAQQREDKQAQQQEEDQAQQQEDEQQQQRGQEDEKEQLEQQQGQEEQQLLQFGQQEEEQSRQGEEEQLQQVQIGRQLVLLRFGFWQK
jgi:hypothetical protein